MWILQVFELELTLEMRTAFPNLFADPPHHLFAKLTATPSFVHCESKSSHLNPIEWDALREREKRLGCVAVLVKLDTIFLRA